MSVSTNQVDQKIKNGKAPKSIRRVDKGNPATPGDQDHLHFDEGENTALNKDGTWRHVRANTDKNSKRKGLETSSRRMGVKQRDQIIEWIETSIQSGAWQRCDDLHITEILPSVRKKDWINKGIDALLIAQEWIDSHEYSFDVVVRGQNYSPPWVKSFPHLLRELSDNISTAFMVVKRSSFRVHLAS